MAIISIIQALALLYVFYLSVMALNKMKSGTPHAVRYAHIALTAGSAAGVASCIAARDVFECLFAVGIALFMAGTRRENEK
jgi:hypothetical protein